MDRLTRRYIALHEGRKGLRFYRFESRRNLHAMGLIGLTLHSDLDGDRRDLLRFLNVALEPGEYLIVRDAPESLGTW